MDAKEIYDKVNDRYGATARAARGGKYGKAVAETFGYSPEDLATIPQDANLGLSCGNPIALANLKECEVVIDLGCGAGFDVFLAARKAGEKGRAIGVDMNDYMLAKAHENRLKAKATNVSFLKGKIGSIPLASSIADVIISNCVINLVPDAEKHQVFKEMYRLLKPGGRVAVSDTLAKKELNMDMKNDVALYVGCIAGASRVEAYDSWLEAAGFNDIIIVDSKADLNVYTQTGDQGNSVGSMCCGDGGKGIKPCSESSVSCCRGGEERDGGVVQDLKSKYGNLDLNEWAGSYKIFAVKPGGEP
ncbi:putative ubiE/COQ5 methyltransferase [Zopfia rhizophila CBS 207.26]|uniref:Arsenite methyltransferase n=1 Tax=Zopfia rhizophila CBS 207.26 TaxID=1314779 RepID=A0A6A6E6J5_9PEZI|nr:putative ubiE/COQ5 methyltransferase [Zopfia rhizophila CBS 207.26]